MAFTIDFLKTLWVALQLSSPLLVAFMLLISLLGQIVGHIQQWPKFETFYWSFITAFTVGYGDRVPSLKTTKIIALFISLIGIMFTGVVVAITVEAATHAFKIHHDLQLN
ncbi:potassium channel family protein [Paraferrimonas sp. SM1919]|uniref:potassium channel family protein n=1 Tax=Paraferrimonas sp. SM1919 TaxID=2662263 RepID=UPI0013D0F877|nr:potassium channel family protein [Paraferrimonas sp. SM1919]